jgi:hypothetical protein
VKLPPVTFTESGSYDDPRLIGVRHPQGGMIAQSLDVAFAVVLRSLGTVLLGLAGPTGPYGVSLRVNY